MQTITKTLLIITLLGMIGMCNGACMLCGGNGGGAGAGGMGGNGGGAGAGAGAGAGGMGGGAGAGAGDFDTDTNSPLSRLIFAQGFVGGPLPVGSVAKVPLILG